MRALVTGGAGFVGSTLVDRLLAEDHEVDVVDDLSTGSFANLADARRDAAGRLKIHQVDVRSDPVVDVIARREPDVVFHLAAHTRRRDDDLPAREVDTAVVGTAQVLEGARRAGVRKVVLAIGARALADDTVRAAGVRAALDLADLHRRRHGLEHTVVVLPTVFGPRQHRRTEASVVATFAERLVSGQPCVIHGTGEQTRDLLYVDDAVDALVKAAEHAAGLQLEVGTGVQTSVRDLYLAMAAIVGVTDEAVPGATRPGDVEAVPIDPERARIYLGWSSWTPLAEGLTDTIVALGG